MGLSFAAGVLVYFDPRQIGATRFDGIFSLGRRRKHDTTSETKDPTTTATTTAINAYQKKEMRKSGKMSSVALSPPLSSVVDVVAIVGGRVVRISTVVIIAGDAVVVVALGVTMSLQMSDGRVKGGGRYLLTMAPILRKRRAPKDANTPTKAPTASTHGHNTP